MSAPSLDRATNRSPFGASHRLHPNRAPLEFYPTPPEATRALLSVESFDGPIWEPACGDGAIARELSAAGYDVTATDIADYGYGSAGVDFLRETQMRGKHIVTNPPYGRGLADRFVGQALRLTRSTGGSVAMLLNLASLSHPSRHPKFIHTPPAAIYALDELDPSKNPRIWRRSTDFEVPTRPTARRIAVFLRVMRRFCGLAYAGSALRPA